MARLNLYTPAEEEGEVSTVTLDFDHRNQVHVCSGDDEIWVGFTTVEGSEYALELVHDPVPVVEHPMITSFEETKKGKGKKVRMEFKGKTYAGYVYKE
jgi:hypothetical protein